MDNAENHSFGFTVLFLLLFWNLIIFTCKTLFGS